MSAVKSAFHSIAERIKDGSIFTIKPLVQDRVKEIRYTKKIDFNEEVVREYFKKKIDLNSKRFNNSLLKDPFFLWYSNTMKKPQKKQSYKQNQKLNLIPRSNYSWWDW